MYGRPELLFQGAGGIQGNLSQGPSYLIDPADRYYWGSTYSAQAVNTVMMDSTRAIIYYPRYGGGSYAAVLSITGSAITTHSITQVSNTTNPAENLAIIRYSATKAFCIYTTWSNIIPYGVFLTLNGDNTITVGTPVQLSSTYCYGPRLAMMSATKLILAGYSGTFGGTTARSLTVDGSIVTSIGPEVNTVAGYNSLSIVGLTSTRAVVSCHADNSLGNVYGLILNGDDTLTISAAVLIDGGMYSWTQLRKLSDTTAVLSYGQQNGVGNTGPTLRTLTYSGAIPVFDNNEKICWDTAMDYTYCCVLTPEIVVIGYTYFSGANFRYAKIGVPITTKTSYLIGTGASIDTVDEKRMIVAETISNQCYARIITLS
jgi:hypothetical protein